MDIRAHWGIFLSNQVDKNGFVATILSGENSNELSIFNGKKGILFSDIAIANFIKKEYQYDTVATGINDTRKLRTFSSGERKKVFLNYCINQKPDYIIIDNPLDHLDQNSRKEITVTLTQLAQTTPLILLVNRQTDMLSFITNKAHIKDNSFYLHPINTENKETTFFKSNNIPAPIEARIYTEEVLVKMRNLCVSYHEKPILDTINWTIKKGDFWHLLGPNGSGKSTLLSLITGENTKGYGQDLTLFGIKKGSGENIWDIKKNIGYFSTAMTDLFQKNDSLEHMVLSGFFDSIGLYVQPTNLQVKIVLEWLDLIGLSELKNTPFKNLSIGQQRLALIVRAVLKHPPLLILDEAVEGLDDENVAIVAALITLLSQQKTMAIIYVSHRIEANINPNLILELTPNKTGSTAKIKI
ncbi:MULTISPECIES: ATP-binding cassette domain-containing protein [unclassified Flavobacterium]|uniref:ATP-binding cassette domain-containing protein n=1 Tax=unclassified Flavobacterium TaxID=196869 RepID=UPI00156E369D|nr:MULTISPECIES: ATP-binding cassette domain-containing protein [unclassified Flavobacterium]MBE0393805.1 putative ABC transporter ATP-binding protein YlmA [Flavobacterium sp. PL002]NRT14931.1 molybdate transport system ATP-binding protein [Flavobacterium sp. 28A]